MRIALLFALAACPAPASPPAQTPTAPMQSEGCATVPLCTEEGNKALEENDIKKALDGFNRACVFGGA